MTTTEIAAGTVVNFTNGAVQAAAVTSVTQGDAAAAAAAAADWCSAALWWLMVTSLFLLPPFLLHSKISLTADVKEAFSPGCQLTSS
jgi:hypothetical protein